MHLAYGGGACFVNFARADVWDSTFSRNGGGRGGAMCYIAGARGTLTGSLFSSNLGNEVHLIFSEILFQIF